MLRTPSLIALAFTLTACDPAPTTARDHDPPTEPSTTTDTTLDPAATASASASADADAGSGAEALAGVWEGNYDAKKGRVSMPTDVKDPARNVDDGKQAAGAGSVEITIRPDGDVTGKSQGVLGPSLVRGKIDGKMLRSSFVPADPLAPRAMTGVLVGLVKGDTIVVELRVAGPDAVIVRQANFELKKRPSQP